MFALSSCIIWLRTPSIFLAPFVLEALPSLSCRFFWFCFGLVKALDMSTSSLPNLCPSGNIACVCLLLAFNKLFFPTLIFSPCSFVISLLLPSKVPDLKNKSLGKLLDNLFTTNSLNKALPSSVFILIGVCLLSLTICFQSF